MQLDELTPTISNFMLSSDERIVLDKIDNNVLLSEFEQTVAERLIVKGVLNSGPKLTRRVVLPHWRF